MKYELRFTLFNDKTRKCVIEADSPDDAEYKLRGKIKILSVNKLNELNPDSCDAGIDMLNQMFGMKK